MTLDEKRRVESALAMAAGKRLKTEGVLTVRIDRFSNEINFFDGGRRMPGVDLAPLAYAAARELFKQNLDETEKSK